MWVPPGRNRAQQVTIKSRHLFETERVKNTGLSEYAKNRLGRRGSGVQIAPPRPMESKRWRPSRASRLWKFEETASTDSSTYEEMQVAAKPQNQQESSSTLH